MVAGIESIQPDGIQRLGIPKPQLYVKSDILEWLNNNDDMKAQYGSDLPFSQVLSGSFPVPANARHFVSTVARYFVVAKSR